MNASVQIQAIGDSFCVVLANLTNDPAAFIVLAVEKTPAAAMVEADRFLVSAAARLRAAAPELFT